MLGIWVTRETYEKLRIFAKGCGMTVTGVMSEWIERVTCDIELTGEQYEEISRAMRGGSAGGKRAGGRWGGGGKIKLSF